jgi:D-alanyl-D-alanine carboxypeptidase (penicillin-binding protein 5/6)
LKARYGEGTTVAQRKKKGRGRALGLAAFALVAALATEILAQAIKAPPPPMTAKSVFVMNADTGQVLYEKNPDQVFRILSLTKLVTAYVLLDQMGDRLSESVTISGSHLTGGSSAGLKRGDVWSLQNLLYGMVLVSGNDASLAIADHVGAALLARQEEKGEARERFVAEMESAAHVLGAKQAGFADPYGLSPSNVATARDMGLVAARIFTDPRLLPAWACTIRTIEIGGTTPRTVILDTSLEILGEDGVIGAKTGSHMSHGIYNLVTAWRARNGETIVGVILEAGSNAARYNEMRAIIAALPQDFPALAQPPAAPIKAPAQGSCL